MAKLNKHEVKAILRGYYKDEFSTKYLADFFEVSMRQVQKIVKGEAWSDVFDVFMENWGYELFCKDMEEIDRIGIKIGHAMYRGDLEALATATAELNKLKAERNNMLEIQ